jgi:hypothetical protein
MKLVILAAVIFATAASAQMEGTGIGLIIGEPTGVSVKHWLSGNSALTVRAAWAFQHEGSLFLSGDYTLHSFNISNEDDFRNLAFYYGIGAKVSFVEKKEESGDEAVIGARIPLGLMIPIGGAPVDIFVELAPSLDLIPETELGLNGGIGAHLFF